MNKGGDEASRTIVLPLAMFCIIALACEQGTTQDSGAQGHAERGRIISIGPVKQMRPDVDAWPLIQHSNGRVEGRVNAALVQLNKELEKTLRDCDEGTKEFEKQEGTAAEEKSSVTDDWSRSVEVAMSGPRFLSMIATDAFFCGGAHPDDNLTVVVFDLQTGEQVDWSKFVDRSAQAASPTAVLGYESGSTPPLTMPKLRDAYIVKEEPYCQGYFEEIQSFFVWPDAGAGALVVQAAGLPHVAAPCKVDFKLTLEQARKLGFTDELLRAIEDGHRQAALPARH